MVVKQKKNNNNYKLFTVSFLIFIGLASLVISLASAIAPPLITYVLIAMSAFYCVIKITSQKHVYLPAWVIVLLTLSLLIAVSAPLAYPALYILGQDLTVCEGVAGTITNCSIATGWTFTMLRVAGVTLIPLAVIMAVLIFGYFSRIGSRLKQ